LNDRKAETVQGGIAKRYGGKNGSCRGGKDIRHLLAPTPKTKKPKKSRSPQRCAGEPSAKGGRVVVKGHGHVEEKTQTQN